MRPPRSANGMIGLSKERPILGDHSKAHVLDFMKSAGISADFMKSGRFHVDFIKSSGFQVKSTNKTYKSNISEKLFSFMSAVGRLCHVFT